MSFNLWVVLEFKYVLEVKISIWFRKRCVIESNWKEVHQREWLFKLLIPPSSKVFWSVCVTSMTPLFQCMVMIYWWNIFWTEGACLYLHYNVTTFLLMRLIPFTNLWERNEVYQCSMIPCLIFINMDVSIHWWPICRGRDLDRGSFIGLKPMDPRKWYWFLQLKYK